jgi:hypothetical protein
MATTIYQAGTLDAICLTPRPKPKFQLEGSERHKMGDPSQVSYVHWLADLRPTRDDDTW